MGPETLTLVVPGLFGSGHAQGKLPVLERLVARADPCAGPVVPHDSYEATLCGLFGIRAAPGRDLPIAALTHLVDFDAGHEGSRPGARAWEEQTAGPSDPLHRIEEQWFAPLLTMLQRRRLARLTVYTDTRGFTITRGGAWRVWRRAKPLPSS